MTDAREVAGILDEAVAAGVTPGAAACVFRLGDDAEHTYFVAGAQAWDEGAPAVRTSKTVYDLASLTKVLSTTVLSALAVSEGKVDLDERPWTRWPGVSVRDVLLHRGGLPAWEPLFEDAIAQRVVGLSAGRDVVVEAALDMPPAGPRDSATVYSDLGFIALGVLLEERLGDRLDRLFSSVVAPRLRAPELEYVPLYEVGYHPRYPDVAATEACRWRGRVMQGQVHDDNCFAMGGVAGHAGLFGTVVDVANAAGAMLQDLVAPQDRWGEQLRSFSQTGADRRLGFDVASEGGSTGGALSAGAVGHLGFTGTSLWLDPGHPGGPAGFVLLTNRVHTSREGDGIKDLRQDFHRAAARYLATSAQDQ